MSHQIITLSSHILDTHLGKPASGVTVLMHQVADGKSQLITKGITNADGRITHDDWCLQTPLQMGRYTLTFDTQTYFNQQNLVAFYPQVVIDFLVQDESHYHIPLLLSAHGYSTYRGS